MSDKQNKCTEPEVKEGYAFTFAPVRWKPYKPASQQFKRGIKGRWQQMNDYAGWDNCEAPHRVYSDARVVPIEDVRRIFEASCPTWTPEVEAFSDALEKLAEGEDV